MPLSRAAFLRCLVGAAGVLAAPQRFGVVAAQAGEGRMLTRAIPSTGDALPVVGVGTWRGFDVGQNAEARARLTKVLAALFDAGGSVIDSSPMYGTSEEVTGDLLAAMQAQQRAFVATKVWTSGRDAGVAQMEASSRLLRDDRIELMQIHNLMDWRTHLPTMRAWKQEGRLKYLGVTHYRRDAHGELGRVLRAEPFDFVQLNYSIDDRAAEETLLPLAQERGVAVLVNLPFGGGGLLRRVQARPLPAWAPEIGCETWAQVLLKFVLAHPAVTCVIPGTGRPEHMRENARAGFGVLPDEALRRRMVAELAG
jgi:aryl-alcohol dehydrogenase-like predicted oxidoreductase